MSTTPSRPPSASPDAATTRSQSSGSETSATIGVAAVADQRDGLLRGRLVTVDDRDPRALDRSEHAHGLAVAGGCLGVAVALPAAADDEHAAALQAPLDVDRPLRRRGDDGIDTVGHMAIIPYAHEDPQDDRVRAVLDRLPEPRINLFTMLANAPALIGPALRLGEAILTRSDLPAGLRELAILQSAKTTGTEYEWVQHEAIAKLVGVPDEKIEAIRSGDLDALEPAEAAAMRLVDQCIGAATPDEALVREVADHHGRNGLVELLLVAGYYAMLGGVMRAVRIDVDSVLEKGMIDAEQLQ